MSILRGDFAPDQVAAIEAAMDRTGLPFASAVRMLIDYGINARQGYRMATESLPGETSKEEEEGEGETPESQDPTVIETERKGSGENGESVSVLPKRRRKIPVAISDPPAEIDSPELRAFLPEFVEYRRKVKKSPLAPAGWNLLFNRLKPAGREHAVLALRYSISNNWKSFDVEWLKGKSWATIASELGLSLEAEKPALSPVDLAALDLKRAVLAAEKEIRDVIAPASDGWLTSTRTVFFDHLDACKSEAEVEAHLAACRALCDRLRAMGAFPLRRATQPGEILPAGSGGLLAVDLRGAFICDSTCPACGEDQMAGPCSCGDQNDPAVGGPVAEPANAHWLGCEARYGDGPCTCRPEPLAIGCDRGCPAGGPCASWPEPCPAQFAPDTTDHPADCECTACVAGYEPWQKDESDPLADAETPTFFQRPVCGCGTEMVEFDDGHACPICERDFLRLKVEIEACPHGVPFCYPCGECDDEIAGEFWKSQGGGLLSAELAAIDPPNPDFFNAVSKLPPLDVSGFDDDQPGNADPSVEAAEAAHSRLVEKGILSPDKKRAKIADGQHVFEGRSQSVHCIHCGMPKDHIRHYLPQELPFTIKEEP